MAPFINCITSALWSERYKFERCIGKGSYGKVYRVVSKGGSQRQLAFKVMPLEDGETPEMKMVRFRTLGCYPLTGAIESEADTLPKIIEEMLRSRDSERQGRVIDFDEGGSMEDKKREGYF